jgi:hypothetical protein
VTAVVAGSRPAAAAVIATGKRTVPAAGRYSVTLKATSKGRKPLRRARKLRVTLTVSFTDSTGTAVKRSKKVVLRRKTRRS